MISSSSRRGTVTRSCCTRLPRRKRARRDVAPGTARGSMADRAAMVFRALNRKCGLIRAWRGGLSAIATAHADSSRGRTWATTGRIRATPAPLINAVWASMR